MKRISNKLSKISWEKVALSRLSCNILSVLQEEGYVCNQKYLSERTKSGVSGVCKSLLELMNYGLIAKIEQSVLGYIINPFRTEEIKRFLTGWKLGKNRVYVLTCHASTYEAEIKEIPERLIKKLQMDKSFIGYFPSGWKALKKTLIDGSFKLHKTNRKCKIIAYFRTFGFSPEIIEQINNEKFLNLKSDLEDKYQGLKIGNSEEIAKCPWNEYALLKDYIAVGGIKLGIKHKKIEQSYDYGEWEEKGHDARDRIKRVIALREFCIKEEIEEWELAEIREVVERAIFKLRFGGIERES